MKYLTAIYLLITNKRFTKDHRINNTWQYRYLNTVGANLICFKIESIIGKYFEKAGEL
jgi:predicted cupin superfamily sugar epimerase